MSRSSKVIFSGFVALLVILSTIFWFSPLRAQGDTEQSERKTFTTSLSTAKVTKSNRPLSTQSKGPYRVAGNVIVGADGKQYLLQILLILMTAAAQKG